MKVVISQSFYFPWVGLLEQIRLADVYVAYDDVQFTKGGFLNRVQAKTAHGSHWLTVPTADHRSGQRIREVQVDRRNGWERVHLETLAQAYAAAPHRDEMLAIARDALADHDGTMAGVTYRSVRALARYFGIDDGCRFIDSAELGVGGASSRRVLDIVRAVGGTTYVTGHGARRYLDHALFEAAGIAVEYMDYERRPYPQLHGAFTPYVSALDLAANCGRGGARVIASGTVGWRAFREQAA